MIYLLSQMFLALAVAVVLGGALGWLAHRATHSQKNHRLKQNIASLQNRLAQAKSEVAMLNDDYDEMQRQSQDQIVALREENRQLPILNSNLEKSQLLVRQMMQRHETKVRELTREKEKLASKLAKSREQDTAHDGAKAGLETGKGALFVAAESDADPFDEVMEVADEMQRELDMTGGGKVAAEPTAAEDVDAIAPDSGDNTEEADDLDTLIALDDVGEFTDATGAEHGDTLNPADENLTDENPANENPADETIDASLDALQLDGSSDDATLFQPVSQHDDLQQIFGIGPLTEKALNELGITSYSQLAELKQHEIQHIADALEIGPGRIERDNWVGNARRQLEDVLEQL